VEIRAAHSRAAPPGYDDITTTRDVPLVHLPRSTTDQTGTRHTVALTTPGGVQGEAVVNGARTFGHGRDRTRDAVDPASRSGSEFYDNRLNPERRKRVHIHQLEAMGYKVTLEPAA
jgi:hypothetical protein